MSVLSQGTFDGFCGLYAASHLTETLAADASGEVGELVFFELLKALERRGRLTAKRIASTNPDELGFTCGILKTAFNDIPARRRFGFASIAFTQAKFQKSRFRGDATVAFAEGCGFIIRVDSGNHWVATDAFATDGQYDCFDPSTEQEHSKFGKIFWDLGLMVGPSELIESL